MAAYFGVLVSDPWLQNQFTQVELRTLKSHFSTMRRENGGLTLADLPSKMSRLKHIGENLTEQDRASFLPDSYKNLTDDVDFELFLRVYLKLQSHAATKIGSGAKNSSAFLKSPTSTLLHTISESEKSSYVAHINHYLAKDEFLKKYLPIDPSTNDLFEFAKDGVLICKLINVAVPGTIDERAINTKRVLNPWERNENHTLGLNSAKAIGCTVVNIGTQDFIEGRRHLVLGVISQIIKIQLLADLNLKKTPQLVELVDDSKDMEELMSLPPEKILLRWMNFQLKKAGYKKSVTNFSTDVKDGEAYAYLLNVLALEHSNPSALAVKDPLQRAKLVLEHVDRMGCKRYLTAKDIVEGSSNLNLAFVAHIFQHRNGLSTQEKQITFLEVSADDTQIFREESAFRFWINSFGHSTYINNVFEDVRNGWVLLETLDKVSPGIVNWKVANKPPIKLPFKKVENCNQVVKIGKQLKFSLVNIAGNDIVQGNKKLILAYLWQLMRCNMLQLLKNLRFHSHGKEITDADILDWANTRVGNSGRQSRMKSFKVLHSVSDSINFNRRIWDMYFTNIVPKLVKEGDDGNCGSTAVCDTICLQALSKRIHYGKFVAEAKFHASPDAYEAAIKAQDRAQLMNLLTYPAVEEVIKRRVEMKTRSYGKEVMEDKAEPVYKIKPSLVADLYGIWIMPLTKEVQVEYLLRRLD